MWDTDCIEAPGMELCGVILYLRIPAFQRGIQDGRAAAGSWLSIYRLSWYILCQLSGGTPGEALGSHAAIYSAHGRELSVDRAMKRLCDPEEPAKRAFILMGGKKWS